MRTMIVLALFLASTATGALAQTYRCNVGGKAVYSDTPCTGGAAGARVDSGADSVSQRQEIDALRQALSQKQQLQRIEREKAADNARVDAQALSQKQQLQRIEREKAADNARVDAQAASAAAEDRRQAAAKASRCAAAQSAKADNDRRVARYQDWGWQNSQNQARAERESAERRVRDNCE